jgi:hypothetical protein
MKSFVKNAVFFVIAAAVILPTPTLVFAWVTGKTFTQIIYR